MEGTKEINEKDEQILSMKIIVMGDISVGKTNVIRRIIGEDFKEVEASIGVEIKSLNIKNIDPENPNLTLSIQIWDTSGAERYRAITTSHIRGADGVFLIYDITNLSTFNDLKYWLENIRNTADEDIVIFLMGNKTDLIEEKGREVKLNDALNYVKANHLHSFSEVSAKNNELINDTFTLFYKIIYKKNKQKLISKLKYIPTTINNNKNNANNDNGCCD